MKTLFEPGTHTWTDILGVKAASMIFEGDQLISKRLNDLNQILRQMSVERILLVIDRIAVEAAGLKDLLATQLTGISVREFDSFSPNPRSEDAATAALCAYEHRAEMVVGIGGGSCLDVAKIAALAARTPELGPALACGEQLGEALPLPLLAVPTTSGTGSEATHFAAIYVNGSKASVAHPQLRPTAVILDPRFHEAMPPRLAACTGLDALGQALESLWSVGATGISCRLAELAGRLTISWLPESVCQGTHQSRLAMMAAAHLAGQAINLSKTTAAHALSYQLTQRFGLPHGHAVALTLGHVAAANAEVSAEDCSDSRGPADVRKRVKLASSLFHSLPAEIPGILRKLMSQLGLPETLQAAGVPREGLAELARAVDPVRLGNNPRRLSEAQIAQLLYDAWQ